MNIRDFVVSNARIILATAIALVGGLWGGVVLGRVTAGDMRVLAPIVAEGEGPEAVRAANAPRARGERPAGMAFMNIRIDTSEPTPRACLEFSQDLSTDRSVNFADYLVIEPAAQVQAQVSGSLLCLSGLPFEPDRQVTIRRGLPSQAGQRTTRDETFTLSFGDRPAYVGFVGNGVILPRSEADGLAIETVNVSRLRVSVVRVNDRILSQHELSVGETVEEGGWGYWGLENAGEAQGSVIYEGRIDVANARARRNQGVTTVFPLGAVLSDRRPGAYVVRLIDDSPGAGANGQENDRPAGAFRWVLYTDLALQTFSGGTGMDVVVRSLRTAQPVGGLTLNLIAENNEVLGRATTDGDGHVRFARALLDGEGSSAPRYVMAYGGGDFAALDLQNSTLDLTDRGIAGRNPPGDVDAYLYTERGIYRPGERVRLIGLVRDTAARAIGDRQSTLVVYRPNGTEARRTRLANATEAGAIAQNIAIDRAAPRGIWRADLLVDGQEAVAGQVSWSVEDFVPQRLRVEIRASEAPLLRDQSRAIDVQADFLYGAPGSGLAVEAEGRLTVDPTPFPRFAQYSFGRTDESFEERLFQLPETMTDGEGHAQLLASIPDPPTTTLPLRARLTASVADPGGRVVREGFTVPVRLSARYIGVRQRFDNQAVPQNGRAVFDVIAVDPAGRQIAVSNVTWQLVQEDWSYDWYLDNGTWRWRRTGRDIPIAGGQIDLQANRAIQVSRGELRSGAYRLIVRDGQGAETSTRFHAGWGGGAESDTPDMVTVAGPTEPVRPGGRAQIQIRPPYAGQAQVVIATDRVLSMRTVNVPAGGATVTIPVDNDWGGGAYVLVTVMTPRDPVNLPVPRRAVGVAYIPVDMASRTLDVAIADGLGTVRPRQRISVPVNVRNTRGGEETYVAIAAVDEGILQITNYQSPDPVSYFYGRRGLGVQLRDDYGRLLNPNLGAPAIPRQGGDGLGGEGLTVVPQRTVSLFSDVVRVQNGRATIELDVPDFNGRLRFMAVAWSRTALGRDAESVIVRDPVVAELNLPRFLAPGDSALANLTVDNVEGPAGAYSVALAGSGVAQLNAQQRLTLARGQRGAVRVPLAAENAGLGRITLTLSGPGQFQRVTRTYDIQSRVSFLPVTEVATEPQGAGVSWRTPNDILAAFAPSESRLIVSYSSLAGLDPAPLLAELERYPYGCSEQLTSIALPLLYYNTLSQEAGRAQDQRIRRRIQETITTLLDRQGTDGAFGLWRANDAHATPWLGAYVTDFLTRARAQGYIVPQQALDNANRAMRAVARLNDFAGVGYDFQVYRWPGSNDSTELLRSRSAAYALYVMAKAGAADIAAVRYFHDSQLRNEPSPLARAQIGAALAHMGDRSRARNAFRQAEAAIGYRNTGDWYQTPLRDLAGVIALAAEAGETATVQRMRARLLRMERDPNMMMTQEQAQLLLAMNSLLRSAGPVNVSLNGRAGEGRRVEADVAAIMRGLVFRNDARAATWRTTTLAGPPREAPPPAAAGYSLDKRVFRMDGTIADLSSLTQGDRVVVVVSGQPEGARTYPTVLVDLLPAGLEIESVLGPQDGAQQS
ncbi:MAG: alpha-2-macroglobulin, partial [Hyphomonadaceae bacterium]